MRWEDAPFVKLYRDNGPWMDISLEARGLFDELLKVVDRAGILPVGADPSRTIARAVNGEVERVRTYLAELLADGCVTIGSGALVIGNFVEAQSARASNRSRQSESRLRARDNVRGSNNQQVTEQNVTQVQQPVTRHGSSVTENGLPVTIRSEEKRSEEKRSEEKEIRRRSDAPARVEGFAQLWGAKTGVVMPEASALLRAKALIAGYAKTTQANEDETQTKALDAFTAMLDSWSFSKARTPQLFCDKWDDVQGWIAGKVGAGKQQAVRAGPGRAAPATVGKFTRSGDATHKV